MDFRATNAKRRRAAKLFPGRGHASAHGTFAFTASHYADLDQGIITVHQGKFRKDRLVPPALPVVNRLRKYAAQFDNRPPSAIFFPGPSGGPFSLRTVYTVFRKLLLHCGIPHAGRGKGPRIHAGDGDLSRGPR